MSCCGRLQLVFYGLQQGTAERFGKPLSAWVSSIMLQGLLHASQVVSQGVFCAVCAAQVVAATPSRSYTVAQLQQLMADIGDQQAVSCSRSSYYYYNVYLLCPVQHCHASLGGMLGQQLS
jgi:hypothetical protein